MTLHLKDDLLQEYVDDELSGAERTPVERHLAECDDCRRSEKRLRSLWAAMAGLPRSIEPARNLWPEVSSRIAGAQVLPFPGARTRWSRWALAAAAAAALVATSSAITWRLARVEPSTAAAGVALPAQLRIIEADYETAADELSLALKSGQRLAPETIAVLERNLRIIDEAILEARVALARDPSNRDLARMLWSTYDGKLDLLKRVTRLAAESRT